VTLLLLAALLQDVGPIIDAWSSDDPAARDKASEAILSRWKTLTDRDLAALDGAAKSADSEVSRRAADAVDRVRTRRRTAHLLRRFPDIDRRLLDGDAAGRFKLLDELVNFWLDDRLSDEEIAPVVAMAVERRWELLPGPVADLARHSRAPFLAPLLRAVLRHPDADIRCDALDGARELRDPRLAPDVAALLGDGNATVRATAAEVAGVLGGRDDVPRLAALLKDPESEVRWNAVQALGRLKAVERVAEVADLLNDRDPGVRLLALGALVRLDCRGRIDAIAGLLADPDDKVRAGAAHAVVQLSGTTERVEPLLKDRSANVRAAVAEVLPFAKIATLSRDPSSIVRLKFIDLATASRSDEAAAAVSAMVGDKEVAWAALTAIGRLGWKGDVAPFVALLDTPDDPLRRLAVDTLIKVRPAGAEEALRPLLKSRFQAVRTAAVEVMLSVSARPSLDDFMPLLEDPSLRTVAAMAVGAAGGPRARDTAIAWARSAETEKRLLAFSMRLPDDEGLALLKDRSHSVRVRAAHYLARSQPDAVSPLIDDPEPDVRNAAIIALVKNDRRECADRIADHLGDLSASVRIQAAWAIGVFRLAGRADAVAKLLEARELDVVIAALIALVRLDAADAVPSIRALLKSDDSMRRARAAWALGWLRSVESARDLVALLDDPNKGVRGDAAEALGRLGLREHASAIALLLDDESDWVREGAIEALGRLGEMDALLPELRRRSARFREAAVNAIAPLDPARCADRLVELLKDKHVAEAAAAAIGRTGDPRHLASLLPLLDDESLASAAAGAIGRLGSASESVVARLRELESRGSLEAGWALVRLGARKPDDLLIDRGRASFDPAALAGPAWSRRRKLAKAVADWAGAKEFLAVTGLALDVDPACNVTLRIPAGRDLSPSDLLLALLDLDEDFIVIDGDTARVLPRDKALAAWKKRFQK
jgi:HEAT repeat protein